MGFIDYREVDWDNPGTEQEQQAVAKTEAGGIIILAVLLLLGTLIFEPVRNIFLSEEQLLRKYARRYEWLNRCDEQCEQLVDTSIINLQVHCQTLTRWYYEEGRRDILSWQLAIDDRATFLGCPGFPKEIEEIKRDVAVRAEQVQEQIEEARAEQEIEQRAREAAQPERFAESIRSGALADYVLDLDHPDGSHQLDILVTAAWETLPERLRRQYAEALWQKWAGIHAPRDFGSARIRLLNPAGTVIGGSPDGAATPIWIAE
jgi:hypothetical protein